MKFWMIALSFVAVLGMTTLADAKGAGKKGHGTKGKVVSVSADGSSFTMTTGSKKKGNEATITVKVDKSTTIDGVAGGKLDALSGKHVSVVGASDGTTITASAITVSAGHHKKKAA